jgi:LysR family glycine cleavage system transcriptional activator
MARQLPPLNALRSFEAAARLQSFSKAALELNVTHGAVSRAIRHLEDTLRLKLFERGTRKVVSTRAGSTYAIAIGEALDRMAVATIDLTKDQSSGVLNVTTLDSFAAKWLVPRLYRFRRAHSDIDVRLSTTERLSDFAAEGIDIAIRFGEGNYPGLASKLLLNDEVFPACNPKLLEWPHPLREPSDLRYHTLIHDDFRIDWDTWLRAAGVTGVDSHRGPIFLSSDFAVQAAVQGEGVVLARRSLVGDDLKAGRLVKPFSISLATNIAYYVVCPQQSLKLPKVRAFWNWLFEEAKDEQTTENGEPDATATEIGERGRASSGDEGHVGQVKVRALADRH